MREDKSGVCGVGVGVGKRWCGHVALPVSTAVDPCQWFVARVVALLWSC